MTAYFDPHSKFPRHLPNAPAAKLALALAPLALGAAGLAYAWWRHRHPTSPSDRGRWLRQVIANTDLDLAGREVLLYIRDTLVGQSKSQILRLLGAPSAAAEEGMVVDSPEPARQALAGQWYYRLNNLSPRSDDAAALVVEFDESDKARDARFLLPPR